MSEYDNLSNEMGGKCSTKSKRCQGYRYSVLVYLAVIVEKHPGHFWFLSMALLLLVGMLALIGLGMLL